MSETMDTGTPAKPKDWRKPYRDARRKLEAIMARNGITVEAKPIAERKDSGLWDDKAWKKASHARVDVFKNGRQLMQFEYSAASRAALPDDFERFKAFYNAGRRKSGKDVFHFPKDIRDAFRNRNNHKESVTDGIIFDCVRAAWVPESVDCIWSILMDATEESFDDWCSGLGYDTDSRKALAAWEACRESDRVARLLFGKDLDKARDLASEF